MSNTVLTEKRTKQLAARCDRWYIQTIKGKDKQVYHRMVGGNGEIISVSEGYTRAADCKDIALAIAARMGIDLHLSHTGAAINPHDPVIIEAAASDAG